MKVRWGVIGSGGIARRRMIPEGIVPAGNAELFAVTGKKTENIKAVAGQFGARACLSEEELLDSGIDAVYVATPVHLHLPQVTRAAEAGKHVFCEKPLALNVEEARRMVDVCRASGVKLGAALMMRFHAQHQAAAGMVRSGRLGAPVFARAQLSCWYPPIPEAWRQNPAAGGGGSLMDLGAHCLDLLEMFFGPIKGVMCMIANQVQAYASEDTAVVLVEFNNGARGVVDVLFNVPDTSSRNRLELYGSRGSILAEGTIGQGEFGEMAACLEESARDYAAQQDRAAPETTQIRPEPVNMYRAEIEAFSQAIIDGATPPVDGEAGLRVQKILAACYESAESGRAVAID